MRKVLLEALAKELPNSSIRYSSKLVSIQEDDSSRVLHLHLADGSILETKVLLISKSHIHSCLLCQTSIKTLNLILSILHGGERKKKREIHEFSLLYLGLLRTISLYIRMNCTQVLIGCDGVNSEVARWLGFKKPPLTGRSAIRGCAHYEANHGLPLKFQLFIGNGVKYGIIPCDDTAVYWFFTWSPTAQGHHLVIHMFPYI